MFIIAFCGVYDRSLLFHIVHLFAVVLLRHKNVAVEPGIFGRVWIFFFIHPANISELD